MAAPRSSASCPRTGWIANAIPAPRQRTTPSAYGRRAAMQPRYGSSSSSRTLYLLRHSIGLDYDSPAAPLLPRRRRARLVHGRGAVALHRAAVALRAGAAARGGARRRPLRPRRSRDRAHRGGACVPPRGRARARRHRARARRRSRRARAPRRDAELRHVRHRVGVPHRRPRRRLPQALPGRPAAARRPELVARRRRRARGTARGGARRPPGRRRRPRAPAGPSRGARRRQPRRRARSPAR